MAYLASWNLNGMKLKAKPVFFDRGFDFAYAAKAFFDPHRHIRADLRRSYGEARFNLYGRIDSRVFVFGLYTTRECDAHYFCPKSQ